MGPAIQQQVELLATADQRCETRPAERGEPALDRALAGDAPDLYWPWEAPVSWRPNSSANSSPTSRRVPSAITTVPGSVTAVSRTAKLKGLPTVSSLRALAGEVGQHRTRGNSDPYVELNVRAALHLIGRCDDSEPGTHCAFGIVLMGLRIAEVSEYPSPRYLATWPPKRTTCAAQHSW